MPGVMDSVGPDMTYIAELYEEISRHPPGIGARKLLIEHYMSVGDVWLQGALDEAKKLKASVPKDPDVDAYLRFLMSTSRPAPGDKTLAGQVLQGGQDQQNTLSKPISGLQSVEDTRMSLAAVYRNVRAKATRILSHLLRSQKSKSKDGEHQPKNLTKIQAVVNEDKAAIVSAMQSASSVARNIQDHPKDGIEIAIQDLEDMIKRKRATCGVTSSVSLDTMRDLLFSRSNSVKHALPEELQVQCEIAFMHVEHERLERNYTNDETMLGDQVKDIARTDFYVTEDNYAWSMDELVQALGANGGVFRNPLSRDMFTPRDVKGILMHPTGSPLAALHVEQTELCAGVRVETVKHMENLASVLLADHSSDTIASRTAVDEFLLYVATCKAPPPGQIKVTGDIFFWLTSQQCPRSSRRRYRVLGVRQGTHIPVGRMTGRLEKPSGTPRAILYAFTRLGTLSIKRLGTCVQDKAFLLECSRK